MLTIYFVCESESTNRQTSHSLPRVVFMWHVVLYSMIPFGQMNCVTIRVCSYSPADGENESCVIEYRCAFFVWGLVVRACVPLTESFGNHITRTTTNTHSDKRSSAVMWILLLYVRSNTHK